MIASFVISLRESFEAALVVGVLLAYLARTGNRQYSRGVWIGVTGAVLGSVVLAAIILATLGKMEGTLEEAFEGILMWVAAGLLTYMVFWMHRHSRQLSGELRTRMATAVGRASYSAVGLLAFVAVFREGAEASLYLSTIMAAEPGPGPVAGAAMGFGLAIALGAVVYKGGQLMNLRTFFTITSAFLVVFAAGLVASATRAFQTAGFFPGTFALWDTSGLLPDASPIGVVLGTLLGYTSSPSLLQVILWLAYLALIGSLIIGANPRLESAMRLGRGYTDLLYRVLRWAAMPRATALFMGAVFVGLLAVALLGLSVGPFNNQGPLRWGPFQNPENDNNLFTFAMWIIWLPLISLGTVLLGRVWCGNLCPLRLLADAANALGNRIRRRALPLSPYLRLGWLLPITFILITFYVITWPVQSQATSGAYLFLGIIALAVPASVILRRGAWCRYLCPVGGWLARIARLSPLSLKPDTSVCATCRDKPCLTGTAVAGRCPSYLNPSQLESNRYCLACWDCVKNCPIQRSSLKLALHAPSTELFRPTSPDFWESVFVASLLGMYIAVGHRSLTMASWPWPALFVGSMFVTTALYLAMAWLLARLSHKSFREAVATFGYIFLPLEFGTAVITFGDDALEFLGITSPAASALLAVGFVWSVVLGVSILRRHIPDVRRGAAAGVVVGVALVALLFLWVSWYSSGTVIDLT